jgi:molecular chaperone DnaJ
VRGKGVSKRDGNKGDLLVTVEVLVPSALNDEARAALNSYAEAVGSANPRAKLFAAG